MKIQLSTRDIMLTLAIIGVATAWYADHVRLVAQVNALASDLAERKLDQQAILEMLAGKTPTSSPTPKKPLIDAIVVRGAKNVSHDAGGSWGSHVVSYTVLEDRPAPRTIHEISRNLASQGWTALDGHWVDSGAPKTSRVRVWSEAFEGTPEHIDTWATNWQDSSGNIVIVFLEYRWPWGHAESNELTVTATWMPKLGVSVMQAMVGR